MKAYVRQSLASRPLEKGRAKGAGWIPRSGVKANVGQCQASSPIEKGRAEGAGWLPALYEINLLRRFVPLRGTSIPAFGRPRL